MSLYAGFCTLAGGDHSSGPRLTRRLKRPYPRNNERAAHPSYLVLLRMGFDMRARSLARRWALTPPFHPYPCGRFIFCATFRGSLRAAVSGHPALWSPDFPPRCRSDRPAHSSTVIVACRAASSGHQGTSAGESFRIAARRPVLSGAEGSFDTAVASGRASLTRPPPGSPAQDDNRSLYSRKVASSF